MAFPIAAIAPAVLAAAGQGAQIYAQGKMNKRALDYNNMAYARSRQDALADWNMQNAYNSPLQQMQRYKEAGLNPNLIYGQSNEGATVRSPDVQGWSPKTPDYAGLSTAAIQGFSAFQDYTLQAEQIKNMEAQRNNMRLDSVLKTIDIAGEQIKNARNELELSKANRLYDTAISTQEEMLRSLQTSTDIKISTELRNAAIHAPNLAAAFERVALLSVNTNAAKQQVENLKKTGILQDLEIGMRKLGMTYNDNMFLRLLAQFANGKSLSEVVKSLKDAIFGGRPSDGSTIEKGAKVSKDPKGNVNVTF